MLRTNNYTTALLVIIVLILIVGVCAALYYVLDLDWFGTKQVSPYVEPYVENNVNPYSEEKITKTRLLDLTKRKYNQQVQNDELTVVAYTDGTVGITMEENEKYSSLEKYKELVNKEMKLSITNIAKIYVVQAGEEGVTYIVAIDIYGNLYKLDLDFLETDGIYRFIKIEGIAKIVDIKNITNDKLVENTDSVNAIAIDYEGNELLITDYLANN